MLRRFLVLTCILFGLSLLSITTARTIERHLPPNYNCISLGLGPASRTEASVQLNRHLNTYYAFSTSISPNGRYALKTIAMPAYNDSMVVIEDAETNTIVRLQYDDEPLTSAGQVKWSADSQYVAYTVYLRPQMEYLIGIYSTADRQNHILKIPNLWAISFSDDNAYLAVQGTLKTLYFVSLRTFQSYPVLTQADYWYNPAWSPQGHRFAATTSASLLVVDVDRQTYREIPFKSEVYGIPSWIEWSDHYLVMDTYQGANENHHLYVFDDQYRSTSINIPNAGGYMEYIPRISSWINDKLIYFKPATSSLPDDPRYAMWRFDPVTRQQELIIAGITHYSLTRTEIAFQHAENTLEIWSSEGSTSTHTLAESTTCDWLGTTPSVLRCISADRLTLFEPSGKVFWSPPSDDALVIRSSYLSQGRFTAYVLQQDNRTWVELIDLQTQEIYTFPEALHHTLPETLMEANRYDFNFEVRPSPTGDMWLVKFSDNNASLYRFWPAQNRWEPVFSRGQLANALWSPDGRRFAILQYNPVHPNAPDLMVGEVDSNQMWNLGYFPAYENITWMQCGGIRARILGE